MNAKDIEEAKLALGKLRAMFNSLEAYTDVVRKQATPKAVEMYVALKTLADDYDEVGKALTETVTELKQKTIPEKFETEGVSSFTTTSGYRVTVSVTPRASMKGDKLLCFQWLRDNNLGDIVTETVNASTLSSVAKSMLEEGKELDPDLFLTYLQPNTSVTKIKKAA